MKYYENIMKYYENNETEDRKNTLKGGRSFAMILKFLGFTHICC